MLCSKLLKYEERAACYAASRSIIRGLEHGVETCDYFESRFDPKNDEYYNDACDTIADKVYDEPDSRLSPCRKLEIILGGYDCALILFQHIMLGTYSVILLRK